MLNFNVKHVPNSELKKASVREEKVERKTIEFERTNIKWGIE